MDLADAFTLGQIHAGVTPGFVPLPYRAPPHQEMTFALSTDYTKPAANAADVAFPEGSIVVYDWLWYDGVPLKMQTGYTAPAGTAADVDLVPL